MQQTQEENKKLSRALTKELGEGVTIDQVPLSKFDITVGLAADILRDIAGCG